MATNSQQTLANTELSNHLFNSIQAMEAEQLWILCDSLADAFLTLDDVSRISRFVVSRSQMSMEDMLRSGDDSEGGQHA